MARLLPAVLMLSCLSGCAASTTDYPSLALRDFERSGAQFDAVAGLPDLVPAALPADTAAAIDALDARMAQASAAFASEVPAARRAVRSGAGSAITSDRRSAALVALASLDSQRSQAAVVLADLDLIYVDTTLAFEQRNRVAQVREKALQRVREQDAVLAELRGALR
ncbi:MAG: hypothetical protein WA954_06780 [Parerythrobacter sp.]